MSLVRIRDIWRDEIFINPDCVTCIRPYNTDSGDDTGVVVYILGIDRAFIRMSGTVDTAHAQIFGDTKQPAPDIGTERRRQ